MVALSTFTWLCNHRQPASPQLKLSPLTTKTPSPSLSSGQPPPSILQCSRNMTPFSSVAQSCPTLCDPMNCSTPGLPGHHQLLVQLQSCPGPNLGIRLPSSPGPHLGQTILPYPSLEKLSSAKSVPSAKKDRDYCCRLLMPSNHQRLTLFVNAIPFLPRDEA